MDLESFERGIAYRLAYGPARDEASRIKGTNCDHSEMDRRLSELRRELLRGVEDPEAIEAIEDALEGRRPRW